MIQVRVKTNTARKTVNAEINSTPKAVLDEIGVGTNGAAINLNGTILTATDLNAEFSALGVADGSVVDLNSIVKADGAQE